MWLMFNSAEDFPASNISREALCDGLKLALRRFGEDRSSAHAFAISRRSWLRQFRKAEFLAGSESPAQTIGAVVLRLIHARRNFGAHSPLHSSPYFRRGKKKSKSSIQNRKPQSASPFPPSWRGSPGPVYAPLSAGPALLAAESELWNQPISGPWPEKSGLRSHRRPDRSAVLIPTSGKIRPGQADK